ncbi:MAG: hypothetical protein KJ718_04275, partial [Nanoarchaeota archaeon]|nr:hypothetical protein [Nanoarchaeota archaeon]
YLFSFKRSLKLAENAMKRITGNDKTVGKNESKISADERGPFFTTTQVKENLRQELVRLQKAKLPKEEFIQPSDPLRLAVHLKYKAVVDEPLFEAIEKVINLCDVVDYDSKLTPQEVQQLVAICIPLFNNLASV